MSISTENKYLKIEEKLLSNRVLTDLSEFDIDEGALEIVYKKIQTRECSNIGGIKWHKNVLDTISNNKNSRFVQTFESIETQLILNNQNFEKFPSDFMYCLLCRHVYTCSTESPIEQVEITNIANSPRTNDADTVTFRQNNQNQAKNRSTIVRSLTKRASRLSKILDKPLIKICEPKRKTKHEAVGQLVLSSMSIEQMTNSFISNKGTFDRLKHYVDDEKWIVDRIHTGQGYKSVLYRNDIKRQFVYAHQGDQTQYSDFHDLFKSQTEKNNIEPFFYSILANLVLASQTELVWKYTEECVKASKDKSYSLSFTGYTFGAWLAEQSVYFCHKDFDFENTRAVTFESPGSYDYLERLNLRNVYNPETKFDLDQLDLRTYLTGPNFINTSNTHVGKMYRLFVTDSPDYSKEMKEFATHLIAKFPTYYLKMKFNDFFNEQIKENVHKFAYFLNGLKSLFVNGLDLILNEFDEAEQRPKAYIKVLDWPKVDFEPNDNFKDNFQTIPRRLLKEACDFIPGIEMIPLNFRKLAIKLVSILPEKALEAVSQAYMSGFTVIINFLIEILNGNFSAEQCLKYFALNENPTKKGKELVYDSQSFKLLYEAHYREENVNFFQEEVKTLTRGSMENYLYQLQLNQNDINKLKNKLIVRQLKYLVSCFEMDNSDGNKYIIKVSIFEKRSYICIYLGLNFKRQKSSLSIRFLLKCY